MCIIQSAYLCNLNAISKHVNGINGHKLYLDSTSKYDAQGVGHLTTRVSTFPAPPCLFQSTCTGLGFDSIDPSTPLLSLSFLKYCQAEYCKVRLTILISQFYFVSHETGTRSHTQLRLTDKTTFTSIQTAKVRCQKSEG